MNIYKIATDFSFKTISGKEGVTGRFHHYKGQQLADEWTPPEFGLLEILAKLKSEINAERNLSGDFDARCYGQMFLLKEQCIPHLGHLPLEFLPIVLEGVEDKFCYVNVLNVVPSIDFEGLDFKQSMDMLKSNTARFIKENIGEHLIFRDQKLTNSYYCTEQFIDLINQHGIKGLRFQKTGEAM